MYLKKIATNIPYELFKEATELSQLNQTQTIIVSLKDYINQKKREGLLALQGRLHFSVNFNKTRKRKKI